MTEFNHELIIAKLAAHGVNEVSLRMIRNYLSKRKQLVKIGSCLSEWLGIILGALKGQYESLFYLTFS